MWKFCSIVTLHLSAILSIKCDFQFIYAIIYIVFSFLSSSSVQFSHSVMSDSLQLHGLQHTRLPCLFMAAVTICSDFGAQENSLSLFALFSHLFAMTWYTLNILFSKYSLILSVYVIESLIQAPFKKTIKHTEKNQWKQCKRYMR